MHDVDKRIVAGGVKYEQRPLSMPVRSSIGRGVACAVNCMFFRGMEVLTERKTVSRTEFVARPHCASVNQFDLVRREVST